MDILLLLGFCAELPNTPPKTLYLPLQAEHLCSVVLLLQNDTQQEVESGVFGAESDSWGVVDSSLLQAMERRLAVLILQRVSCGDKQCGI